MHKHAEERVQSQTVSFFLADVYIGFMFRANKGRLC